MVDECDGQVKWTRVPDLVEKRKVFLKGGWAYVPGTAQSSIVFEEFERNLEKALKVGKALELRSISRSSSNLADSSIIFPAGRRRPPHPHPEQSFTRFPRWSSL